MKLDTFQFETIDWTTIPRDVHPGETGLAYWQVKMMNQVRVRRVEYTAGYKADHWCSKGHVLFCLEGVLYTELRDGRTMVLQPGMCYLVGDDCEAHRSMSPEGCQLFIVD